MARGHASIKQKPIESPNSNRGRNEDPAHTNMSKLDIVVGQAAQNQVECKSNG